MSSSLRILIMQQLPDEKPCKRLIITEPAPLQRSLGLRALDGGSVLAFDARYVGSSRLIRVFPDVTSWTIEARCPKCCLLTSTQLQRIVSNGREGPHEDGGSHRFVQITCSCSQWLSPGN